MLSFIDVLPTLFESLLQGVSQVRIKIPVDATSEAVGGSLSSKLKSPLPHDVTPAAQAEFGFHYVGFHGCAVYLAGVCFQVVTKQRTRFNLKTPSVWNVIKR